ncbi:hypothetical protein JK359_33700 [Streptomyces actinomycinicus]|uniref:Uncharacterized protein n=1 Tax=Streptomyces actinomycinicus TaxID=1695166 RepID=A0A937JTK4_9ACTN|nr:hypothetical protein [Streptomyces actinomycinicus]MBL1086863.1 hypothetical protein [Streptomyces actinomycinicus]
MAVVTAARAAHEILRFARTTPSQDNLRDLRQALRAMGRLAPAEHHLDIVTVHDEIAGAAEELVSARRDFTARRAALAYIDAALNQAEKVMLTLDPAAASPFRPTDIPATPEDITASAIAYNAACFTDWYAEIRSIKDGTPAVRVHCRSDHRTGRTITAVITAGVDTTDGFVAAHPPVAHTFTRLDGRETPADNARRAIAARLSFPGIPIEWTSDHHV